MQICHEKRRFTLTKGCRRSLRARAPARLLLRREARGRREALRARAPWRLRRVPSPGGGPPPRVPLGALRRAPGRAPPRRVSWGGPLRAPPPGESPSARRRLGISSSARRLEATGEDEGLTG